jgi:hypothetical protein
VERKRYGTNDPDSSIHGVMSYDPDFEVEAQNNDEQYMYPTDDVTVRDAMEDGML